MQLVYLFNAERQNKARVANEVADIDVKIQTNLFLKGVPFCTSALLTKRRGITIA